MLSTVFVLLLSQAQAAPVKETVGRTVISAPKQKRSSNLTSGIQSVTPTVGLANMNITGTSGSGPSPSSDSGLSVGAILDISTNTPDLTFQTGALYNQFGAKSSFTGDFDIPVSVKANFTYLSVPVIAKYNFGETDGGNVFYGRGGLMPGYLLSKKITFSALGQSVSQDAPGLKNYDLPIVLGAGMKFPLEKDYALTVEANFIRSLMSIANSGSAYNEGFTFTTGLNIAL